MGAGDSRGAESVLHAAHLLLNMLEDARTEAGPLAYALEMRLTDLSRQIM